MWSLPLYSSYYLIVEERETLLLKLILKSIPWSKTRLEYLWRAVDSKSTAIATAKTAVDNSTTLHIYFECERNDLCLPLLLYPAIAKCILFFSSGCMQKFFSVFKAPGTVNIHVKLTFGMARLCKSRFLIGSGAVSAEYY